jgi:hypothetical protein
MADQIYSPPTTPSYTIASLVGFFLNHESFGQQWVQVEEGRLHHHLFGDYDPSHNGPLRTTLRENETTLFENSPIISARNHNDPE